MSTPPDLMKQRATPTPRDREAMDKARQRVLKRPAPFAYNVQQVGERMGLEQRHSDPVGHLLQSLDTFGTASIDFKEHCIGRLGV